MLGERIIGNLIKVQVESSEDLLVAEGDGGVVGPWPDTGTGAFLCSFVYAAGAETRASTAWLCDRGAMGGGRYAPRTE